MRFQLIVNEQVILKLRDASDAAAVFALVDHNRDYLKQWLPWVDSTYSPKDSEEYIAACTKGFETGASADFGIFYKGTLVGSMGFHEYSKDSGRAAIGYWLSADFQGLGIITAGVQKMLEYGFGELGLNRIEIECATTNDKSRAIPERLGFTLEGTLRQKEKINGGYQDGFIFSMLKDEWLEKKKTTAK